MNPRRHEVVQSWDPGVLGKGKLASGGAEAEADAFMPVLSRRQRVRQRRAVKAERRAVKAEYLNPFCELVVEWRAQGRREQFIWGGLQEPLLFAGISERDVIEELVARASAPP